MSLTSTLHLTDYIEIGNLNRKRPLPEVSVFQYHFPQLTQCRIRPVTPVHATGCSPSGESTHRSKFSLCRIRKFI